MFSVFGLIVVPLLIGYVFGEKIHRDDRYIGVDVAPMVGAH